MGSGGRTIRIKSTASIEHAKQSDLLAGRILAKKMIRAAHA